MRSSLTLIALIAALSCAPLVAHDFWIEPASFRAAPERPLAVSLRVGDFAIGDEVPRNDARIVDFSLRGPDGTLVIVGRDGAAPAGFVRPQSPGLHVLGFRSNHAFVELEAEKFDAYLVEKGLDHVRAERSAIGESGARARELYSRCAKSLVQVGEGGPQEFGSKLGYPLEITPENHPHDVFTRANDHGALRVRVEFDGEPLTRALVCAFELRDATPGAEPQKPVEARTDENGVVSIALPRAGRWMLAVVHMRRAEEREKADWESFWASLTFECQPDR